MKQSQQPGFISLSSSLETTIIVIAAFLVGIFCSSALDSHLPAKLSNFKKGYTRGYTNGVTVTKDTIATSKLGGFFKEQNDIRNLSGKITAISGNQITLHTDVINPFEANAIIDRTIRIEPTTRIVQLVAKDLTTYRRDLAFYMQEAKTSPEKATQVPQPYSEKAITIDTLKVGQNISVTSPVNVKSLQAFTAAKISLSVDMSIK